MKNLKNYILYNKTLKRVLIIFSVGFISRVLVNHTFDINVFKDYTDIVSITYFGAMAFFIGCFDSMYMGGNGMSDNKFINGMSDNKFINGMSDNKFINKIDNNKLFKKDGFNYGAGVSGLYNNKFDTGISKNKGALSGLYGNYDPKDSLSFRIKARLLWHSTKHSNRQYDSYEDFFKNLNTDFSLRKHIFSVFKKK